MTHYERAYDLLNRVNLSGWGDEVTKELEAAFCGVERECELAMQFIQVNNSVGNHATLWVLAADRLPPLFSQVLACGPVNVRRNNGCFVACLKKVFDGILWTDTAGYEREVVWWMPLPKMPSA